jgi:hypothetical protein
MDHGSGEGRRGFDPPATQTPLFPRRRIPALVFVPWPRRKCPKQNKKNLTSHALAWIPISHQAAKFSNTTRTETMEQYRFHAMMAIDQRLFCFAFVSCHSCLQQQWRRSTPSPITEPKSK